MDKGGGLVVRLVGAYFDAVNGHIHTLTRS
jgi:hypothetical protein